jgi:hypothetical protein
MRGTPCLRHRSLRAVRLMPRWLVAVYLVVRVTRSGCTGCRGHGCIHVCVWRQRLLLPLVRARARPARQAAAGVSKACIESARAWRGGRDIGCSVVYAGAPRGRIGAGAGAVPPRAGRCSIAPRTPRVRAPGCFVPPVCVYVSAVDVHFDMCVCVDMHVDVCMRARCNGVHACVCV